MRCKICQSEAKPLFVKQVLYKYNVQYFQCLSCGFVQTEEPYWLAEAYTDAIADMDTGIIVRNEKQAKVVPIIIKSYFKKGKFLDYGAGYGIFVRMMRDRGFDFYWQDEYCENIFAKNFVGKSDNYEMITSFEVFEHLSDPVSEVKKMLQFSHSILFTTNLILKNTSTQALENWWYLSPETGQHIALYTEKSLKKLADNLGLNFYSNRHNFHLLTRKKISPYVFTALRFMKDLQVLIKGNKQNTSSYQDREQYKLK